MHRKKLVAAEAVGVPAVALFHSVSPLAPFRGRPPRGLEWIPAANRLERLRDAVGNVLVDPLYARHALPQLNQVPSSSLFHG